MKTLVASFFFALLTVSSAYAECQYNGQKVPTGTEIDGLVCQADGRWV